MNLGTFGRRVLDTAKKWGRPPPLPLARAPSVPDIVSRAPQRLDDAVGVAHTAAQVDELHRRQVARVVHAERVERSAAAIAAFVAGVRHLPMFSGTATQLIRSMGEENVSGRELVRLIKTDAALVAHLLRIVNSPYFGFARRLATVGDALAVMGVEQVRRTVTAAVLQRPLMAYLHDSAAVRAFWRHELLCAALARHIAMRRGADGELAYMAGLMHDIGRLAMLMQYPDKADALLHVTGDDDPGSLDREAATYGFDHAQAGGALLELWALPNEIVEAAQLHGDEMPPDAPIAASVWHANRFTPLIDAVDDAEPEPPWMVSIGLSAVQRSRIFEEIKAFESDRA